MKAIIYGPSSTLQLAEVAKPVPLADEVLVRVRAASVNPLDAHVLKSSPFVRGLMFKVMRNKSGRPGADIAGEVEAVGRDVTRFTPGDEVFGSSGGGAFAEYACPRESRITRKPPAVSFQAASTVNVAGLTAFQGLRGVQSGQRVLINGASGGVGTFAVQIAKWMGADVTAICSTGNIEMVRELGADRVIDYTRENFIESGVHYDVIYDLVGDKRLAAISRVLTPGGRYIGAGVLGIDASIIKMLPGMIYGSVLSLFTKQKFGSFMAKANSDDLAALAELMQTGKVVPVMDRTYTLEETPAAIRYVAGKHARGKVVIVVEGENHIPPDAKRDLIQSVHGD
jgi:NADPH:quinone reductase-like Zn-dependent oxidoreductase